MNENANLWDFSKYNSNGTPRDYSNYKADLAIAEDAYLDGRKKEAYDIVLQYRDLSECHDIFRKTYLKSQPARQPKVGDILYCSWGYDQTNIDYYQVVGVTPASIKIQEISKSTVKEYTTSYDVVPNPGTFAGGEKPLTKRWKSCAGEPWRYSCKISSYSWAYLWEGQTLNETDSRFGH